MVSSFGFRVVRISFRIFETRNPKLETLKRTTHYARWFTRNMNNLQAVQKGQASHPPNLGAQGMGG